MSGPRPTEPRGTLNGAASLLRRHWFLLGMAAAALAAWLAPAVGAPGGRLHPVAAGDVLVALIFLGNGSTLATTELGRALLHWRLHLYTQGVSLALIPLLALAADAPLAALGVPDGLRTGVLVLACLPTTITSAVVFTRGSGGNAAGALCNAILGNGLGVLLVPPLILLCTGRHGGAPLLATVAHLLLVVALPFLAGQLLRLPWAAAWDRHRVLIGNLGQLCLLVIVWHVFCGSLVRPESPASSTVASTAAALIATHLALVALAWYGSAWPLLRLTRPDRIAATICASQKTVALGIPVITCLFPQDPQWGLITLPLVLYHPIQIGISAVWATRWERKTMSSGG